jgi:large subunit ribosomal protein L3
MFKRLWDMDPRVREDDSNGVNGKNKMTIGLVGKKCGMTRIFTEEGESIPVTVVEVQPNRITQLKTEENDGYFAIQVTTGERKASRVKKPLVGHYTKAGVSAGNGLWEFRLSADKDVEFKIGDELSVELFNDIKFVDVKAISKGKGFAGTIKRHNFAGQDASHGNSLSHRVPGSIGQNQSPGRVFKGKKMAGHLGAAKNTIQNQKLIKIDIERGLLLIKGVVPGAPGGYVIVLPAYKKEKRNGA